MTTAPLPPLSAGQIADTMASRTPVILTTPHEALALAPLVNTLAQHVYGRSRDTLTTAEELHLLDALEAHAVAQGWQFVPKPHHPRDAPYAPAYLRPLQPDLERLEARLASYFASNRRIPYAYEVLYAGLSAAFADGVREDPEGIISVPLWNHLLAPYGFTWDGNPDSLLTPLLPELPPSVVSTIQTVLAGLTRYTYERDAKAKAQDAGIPVVLVGDLLPALAAALGWSPRLRAVPVQAFPEHPDLRRALVALGWSPHPLHARPDQLTPQPTRAPIALMRALTFATAPCLMEISPGFFPYVTKFVTHHERLIYLEMAGTKTTLKASRAHLLGNRRHVLMERELLIAKDDGIQTLRTPLPCGWEQWALFHRQLSPQSAAPDPFYLLDDDSTPIPPLFSTMLARALPLPLLPAWMDYLWLEGRLAGFIQPVDGTHGTGAWHITLPLAQWQSLLYEGLTSGTLTF